MFRGCLPASPLRSYGATNPEHEGMRPGSFAAPNLSGPERLGQSPKTGGTGVRRPFAGQVALERAAGRSRLTDPAVDRGWEELLGSMPWATRGGCNGCDDPGRPRSRP